MLSLEPGIPMNPQYEYTNHGLELLKSNPDLHEDLKIAHATKSYNGLRASVLLQRPDYILPQTAQKLLTELKASMTSFVRADSPVVRWSSQPPSSNPDLAAHVDSLQLLGDDLPLVMLKDLGGFIDDSILSSRVQNLFMRGKKTVIVNASGSGKTRLTFEGLCHNWGFYFAMQRALTRGDGSKDLAVMTGHIGAVLNPAAPPESLERHHAAAERHLSQVLLARLLIFDIFVECCVGEGLTEEHKKQWLFLQVFPSLGNTADIFKTLAVFLGDYDTKFMIPETVAHIRKLLGPDSHLFFVLDEAQTAADTFPKAFDVNYGTYPYLRKIVDTWDMHFSPDSISWVIAGTRISKRVFEAPQYVDKIRWTSDTGSLDDPALHEQYMRQFLPPSLLDTDSGKAFLQRAWAWTRGRHRYTASLLTELLVWNFQQPHTVLDTYIEKATHFRPTDGKQWTEAESSENIIIPANLDSLTFSTHDFSSLNHLDARDTLREVIYHYTAADRPWPIFGQDMIEASANLGRFMDGDLREVAFNEPIALVGGASFLTELPSNSYFQWYTFVDNCFIALQRTPPPSSKAFASCLVFYFSRIFAFKPTLSDIFTFASPVPAWARQSVELLDLRGTSNSIHGSPATSARNLEEVLAWLEHASTPFCIPAAKASTPDLLFLLRLKNGACMTVVMRLSSGDGDGAQLLADLEETRLFCDSETHADSSSRQQVMELLATLSDAHGLVDPPNLGKKRGRRKKKVESTPPPLLRVVAAFKNQIDADTLPVASGTLPGSQAVLSNETFQRFLSTLPPKTFVEAVAANVLRMSRDSPAAEGVDEGSERGTNDRELVSGELYEDITVEPGSVAVSESIILKRKREHGDGSSGIISLENADSESGETTKKARLPAVVSPSDRVLRSRARKGAGESPRY
ncbi:hypothetical protein R3P38DRAFT_2881878 [Favolaschia claudopus]|uniref:Uncharacterized protein n=1 Tax=Favolaschia claudopus TaxID=2862362 RepID=A0AAW0D122_9AGAR